MSEAKLTAEFVLEELRELSWRGVSYTLPHGEALALLERYTAQVRNEAYEKAANLANNKAREEERTYVGEDVVRQPYANNRLVRLGCTIRDAIRALKTGGA